MDTQLATIAFAGSLVLLQVVLLVVVILQEPTQRQIYSRMQDNDASI
jgi:hypothetical protein